MNFLETQIHLLKKERNIYEEAELFEQNRIPVSELLPMLASPAETNGGLTLEGDVLTCSESSTRYQIRKDVVDFCKNEFEQSGDEWARLNEQFMRYHKSLSVYTLVNSKPLLNYLGEKSGINQLRNATVVDVGGGTGHTLCTFFKHPETLKYILADPNLRLLHDQFLRLYPALAQLSMGHVLCYAEKLPFRNDSADLVMSLSSIDHFKDFHAFFREAYRVCKPGGKIFVSSHLDVPANKRIQRVSATSKVFSYSFWERLSRYLYYRKYKVGTDDHTQHFETIKPIEDAMTAAGFSTLEKEEFYGYFWITGAKRT